MAFSSSPAFFGGLEKEQNRAAQPVFFLHYSFSDAQHNGRMSVMAAGVNGFTVERGKTFVERDMPLGRNLPVAHRVNVGAQRH
jgi:hypothetical protein